MESMRADKQTEKNRDSQRATELANQVGRDGETDCLAPDPACSQFQTLLVLTLGP